jgi:toxin ParE1/3/4
MKVVFSRAKALSLGANALLHQLRPDIGDQARMAIVGRYAILFRITADDLVRVERIVYGGRNLPAVLDQNDMK